MSSRLPRLHSSPDRPYVAPPPSAPPPKMATLKRKAAADLDLEATDQPRKLPAIGAAARPNQPLRPSRSTTINTAARSGPVAPKPLTKPRMPNLSVSASARGTSAPPPPSAAATAAARPRARVPNPRVVSGPVRPPTAQKRLQDLESEVASIHTARAADSARLDAVLAAERAKVDKLHADHLAISRELAESKSHALVQRRELASAGDALDALKKSHAREIMDLELAASKREREVRELKEDLRVARDDLERERTSTSTLKATVAHQSTAHVALTAQIHALQAQITALQSQLDASAAASAQLTLELEAARAEVAQLRLDAIEGEAIRRRLHNTVQELKGNIRVFCRVRPVLPTEGDAPLADVAFPDGREHKEIVLSSSGESATGAERREEYAFGFDRVFEPHATQADVFEDISQLAQSCTDGYNVCIFAYGQTGSGKSFTMEGGPTDAASGMIPRAVEQVFRVAEELKAKGWEYTMEGQFLEIYNETINDLLGTDEFDKKKHEIKHDAKTGRTRVTDVCVVPLRSPEQVRTLLARAQARRSVAATLMNERSSRSHSVFTLRITGAHGAGERCEGSLNLVDLAGSERLAGSGVGGDKDRLRETQAINKSLSALGDVIAALGEKGEKGEKHIPYRNSKLTYLLQNSLSGNSKTLMVLNLSPLAAHLNESLTSLRFATKVNNTTIGTAKKQKVT